MTIETLNFWLYTEGGVNENEQLRPYQVESRNNILKAWLNGCRSVMYQSPTGSGKTPTIASIVKMCHDKGFKTLTLAHRDELIDNIRSEYFDMFELETSAIKAGQKRDYSNLHQVASIATYVNSLDFDPDLIITDEGHHCLAPTYLTIYAAHPNAKLLMVTATPYRLSGLGFRDICDELVLGLSVLQLEKMGNIMPAKLYAMRTYTREQIAMVEVVKGEYSESQMSELLSETDQIMSVVDTYIERGEGKQMMLYATDVNHSKKLVEAFEFRGIAAGHVDGKTKNRKEVFTQFINKEIQVLSNCEIATEGNNIPGIEIIGLARKTKSLSLYLQMVGRGSRPADGKSEYLLFDFVDNYWEHGLPNREHDWKSHFRGIERAERKRRIENEEKQFQVKSDEGEVFISTLANLPNGFKGQILHEVDPSNTRHAEILRKQAEKLAEIERKKAEKQAEIERKIAAKEAEIIRRREEKEAAIQRKKDEKLAEIARKKAVKEAAIQKKLDAIRLRMEAREAAKQKKIDDKEAEIQRKKDVIRKKEEMKQAAIQRAIDLRNAAIQRKEDAKQAELQRKEDIRLAKIRQRDEYYERINRNSIIGMIQARKRSQRSRENAERAKQQREDYYKRWDDVREAMNQPKDPNISYMAHHEHITRLLDDNKMTAKREKVENVRILQLQRTEVQFEAAYAKWHNLGQAIRSVCAFCQAKDYPKPTYALMSQMVEPYLAQGGLFTKAQFDEVMTTLELYEEVER